MKGTLFLIPSPIANEPPGDTITTQVRQAVARTTYYLCENVRTARRFIGSLKVHESVESLQFEVLDKDTTATSVASLMKPLMEGMNGGVISESGCPGIADPGALAVQYAHENHIPVVPLTGPSSIILALMASGFNGQQFCFHGYLPVQSAAGKIRKLELESREKEQTQIFIETPYRNNALLKELVKTLRADTRLCVAFNLSSPGEKIICHEVGEWRKSKVQFEKEPAVFLFLASR